MSTKSLCIELIDTFNDEQLSDVLQLLQSIKSIADEAADEAYCQALLKEHLKDRNENDAVTLENFAKELEIDLDAL